jgi:hypothetical protein
VTVQKREMMVNKPDPKKTETAAEKKERLRQEAIAAVRKKYAEAPHPKSNALSKADLALLPQSDVSSILAAQARRERREHERRKKTEGPSRTERRKGTREGSACFQAEAPGRQA